MIQILYLSSAAHPMSTEELLAILRQSLTNNAANGVTGMLLYGNETFLQALEGEEQVVDNLYEKIRKDVRHANIRFLHRRTIGRRQYSDWSMGFKRVSDTELKNIKGLRDFSEKDFNSEYLAQNEAVVETLMDHYRTPYWDLLVRDLDEKDQIIRDLKKTIAHTKGCAEVAILVLESVAGAGITGGLSAGHVHLCELALDTLRQI
jgi:hypothetical protein